MRSLLRKLLDAIAERLFELTNRKVGETIYNLPARETQILLYHSYRALRYSAEKPGLGEVGFRAFSQFEEDGILLYIFALIGWSNKQVVELCAGEGRESMSANLILNHGCWGHLFDGDERNVRRGRQFYKSNRDTFLFPPNFTQAWVTAENVNHLVRESGIEGEIDLLALDIDGMDYWVWQALECVSPRVVVCETNNAIGPELALTVPYDAKFVSSAANHMGASLLAMTKLAQRKGYRLVGTNRYGFNAFFLRNDIDESILPTAEVSECLLDPYSKMARKSRWPVLQGLPWTEV